ncbi:trypsin-like peptidase domain-containing protein [Peptococcaceae bacterium 1198_IL3148]
METATKKPWLKVFLTNIVAGVMGAVLTLVAVPSINYFNGGVVDGGMQQETSASVNVKPLATTISSTTTVSVADIVEQSSKAIVGVVNIGQQSNPFTRSTVEQKQGTGSGVVYKVTANAAYIVTNNHVIEGAKEIEVSLYNGETVTAELVGTDSLTDIAVLKISGNYDITPLTFGDSDALRAGDQVLAIGNPLGLDLSRTVTQGIVSAVNRTISVDTSAGEWDLEVIQTDAAINPGNSGGALINLAGQLVGINSLKITESGVEGLGFAIPSNDVATLVDEITKNGEVVRPYLGVSLAGLNEISPYYRQKLAPGLTDGAMVVYVAQASAAAKAGIQQGDVIVAIDGQEIKDDNDLRKYLYTESSIGDEVQIKFYRQGDLQTVDVTLTSNQQ